MDIEKVVMDIGKFRKKQFEREKGRYFVSLFYIFYKFW